MRDDVIVLQHAACETLGSIEDTLRLANREFRYVPAWAGAPVPESMGSSAGLIVMGGPMGVYEQDRYPFLREELRLIESALKAGVPVLSVCLGSQLLAAVLGAQVRRGSHKEIGWHRVFMDSAAAGDALFGSAPSAFEAFHWHGDVFDLPAGAERMGRSKITECEAFRYGKSVYGILFHMEVTPATVAGMVEAFAGELREEGIDGSVLLRQCAEKIPALRLIGGCSIQQFCESDGLTLSEGEREGLSAGIEELD